MTIYFYYINILEPLIIMKKLFRPFQEMMHNSYEKMTFYKTPRGRSKKIRNYDQIDLTKEFEFRLLQREARKKQRLQELYSQHDLKALGLKDLVAISNIDRSKLSQEEVTALETQENAQSELLASLKKERQDLVKEFDGDTDLKSKVLITGIK